MDVLTSQLPSGGFGYKFPSVSVSPMNFLQITQYLEKVPTDPLDKYLFDIRNLVFEDEKILDCYVMDVDFLIFLKKLITVNTEMTYEITVTCPDCGSTIKKKISLNDDIHFKQIEPQIMDGSYIELNGHKYETIVPTVRDFLKVFEVYLRYKKIDDLKMIRTIALIDGFDINGNQIEKDVLEATHSDITLLLALRELYYDRVEPIEVTCPNCQNGGKRRAMSVGIESLITDFFRDLCEYSPIDGSKILFK